MYKFPIIKKQFIAIYIATYQVRYYAININI